MTEPIHEEEPVEVFPPPERVPVGGWFDHGTLFDLRNNATPLRGVVTATAGLTITYELIGRNGRRSTATTSVEDFRRRVCGKWLG